MCDTYTPRSQPLKYTLLSGVSDVQVSQALTYRAPVSELNVADNRNCDEPS